MLSPRHKLANKKQNSIKFHLTSHLGWRTSPNVLSCLVADLKRLIHVSFSCHKDVGRMCVADCLIAEKPHRMEFALSHSAATFIHIVTKLHC